MMSRKLLAKQVKAIKQNEKCRHCGEDISDQIMPKWIRDEIQQVIRGTDKKDDAS